MEAVTPVTVATPDQGKWESTPTIENAKRQESLRGRFWFWLLFSAAVLWLGPFWNYSAPGTLDPWIYTGYFTNFRDLVNRFGLLYYPSRLPYVLFGVLIYKVFSPLAANYLIKVLILTADTFSLYAIISRHTGRWIAGLTAVVLAFNPYLQNTIGWDYPDGPAIAFLFLGFWMALAPPLGCKDNLAIVATGIFWAMAGYTHLIAGLVIAPGIVAVLFMRQANLRQAVKYCAWLGLGVGLTTVFFGFISLAIFHTFAFWTAQWHLYRFATTAGYLGKTWGTGSHWITIAYRLTITYGITVIGGTLFARFYRQLKKDRFFLRSLLLLVLSDIVFAYVEFGMKAVVLRVGYTSTYMLAPAAIFLGALISALYRTSENQTKPWPITLLALAVAGAILPPVNIKFLQHLQLLHQNIWTVILVLSVIVLVGMSLPGSIRRRGIAAVLFCLTLLVSFSCSMDLSAATFNNRRAEFKAAIATQELLMSGIIKDRPLLFWYDNDERYSYLFNSMHSMYLWHIRGYHDLTHELPVMSADDLRFLIPPDTVVVHFTAVPTKLPERERLLAARNIKVENIGYWTVRRGDVEFEVYLQHVLNASQLR